MKTRGAVCHADLSRRGEIPGRRGRALGGPASAGMGSAIMPPMFLIEIRAWRVPHERDGGVSQC